MSGDRPQFAGWAARLRPAGSGGDRWTVSLSLAAQPNLAGHVVQGVPVLPGSVHVELARAAAAATGGNRPETLRHVRFLRFFVVPRDEPRDLRITVTPVPGGREVAVTGADTGIRHAVAHVPDPAASVDAGDDAPPAGQADAVWRGGRALTGDRLYAGMRDAGNRFGPGFRAITQCRVGAGEAVALITGVDTDGAVVMDAAMQVLAAAVGPDRPGTLVLAGADMLHLPGRPVRRVHARLRPEATDGDIVGDVRLLDSGGRNAGALCGVRLRRLSAAAEEKPPPATRPRVVVAATFTAEPLADALAFWLDTLGLDADVAFAPYRQVYQQLLDPDSLLCTNTGPANVILVRASDLTPAVGDGARYHLPEVGDVAHLHEYETAFLYDEIFVRRSYLRHGIVLPDDAVVVDVGANIGLFTLFVHHECAAARVYAFEPSPDAADALRRNVATHGPATRVFEAGLAEADGERPFTDYRNASVFSGFAADAVRDRAAVRAVAGNVLRSVGGTHLTGLHAVLDRLTGDRLDARTLHRKVTTLSRVWRAEGLTRVDLLKIDAEGYEERVLRGIADEHWPAIRQVVVEAHDPDRVRRVRDILAARGFTVVADDDAMLRGTGYAGIFARRPAARSSGPPARRSRRHAPSSLRHNVDDLVRAARRAAETTAVPLVVVLCPPPAPERRDPAQRRRLDRAQHRICEGLAGIPGVQVVTARDVRRAHPVRHVDAPRAEELGGVPYTGRFFAAVGTLVARRILAAGRPPAKVLVLDCDETLWAGRCGEDGPRGVRLEAPHRAVQEFALRQRAAGTLLCLCSRNNAADVFAVFAARDDLPLRPEHLAAWRLNWAAKSDNLAALAAELGVGTDAMVLLDDDPVECAEVRAHRPEALTVCLPSGPDPVAAVLRHLWAFDRADVTGEDRTRARWYRTERDRAAARSGALDFASFLAGLDLRVVVAPATPADLPRIAQLTQRTHQFTTTAARFGPAGLRAALAAGLECRTVRVRDRFGDYGLVGVMLFRVAGDVLDVAGLSLSCRALGRGVEHRMLAALGELAQHRGLGDITVPLTETGRNAPARAFLTSVAGPAPRDGDVLRFAVSAAAAAHATFRPGDEEPPAAEPRSPAAAGPERSGAPPYERIATELNHLDAVVAAVERRRARRRPSLAGPPGTPGDDLERTVAQAWRRILAIDDVGIDDNFFDLGGTSLRAVQLIAELSERFGRALPAIGAFEHPTVRAMAGMLRGGAEHAGDAGQRRGLRRRSVPPRSRAAGEGG
ncbi:FkbM family methyltransferase [Mangrovihabitans endophyticus]|uniref:Methyltransferase, FkbM family n=1 Tax=Mangrovihabitans endophyticus TaxID=1751298 RepID=A0A8J3BTU9_9ACTN|nr:FkbM family methyltransferase [Mangrovihabitans endophyticus]GGK76621.1 hypothetical protein GCM10012284_08270 [Mangrovihabitans endophyticus]